MTRIISLISLTIAFFTAQSQTRIDSSFAFSTNPAKKYSIYVPSGYNASNPQKMMVGFHPLNLSRWDGKAWCDTLKNFAESNNLLLVCPDGGSNGDISDQIDYGFTEALIDSMKLWYNVDASSIYAMGFSVGGLATYEFGLDHTSLFGGYIAIGAAINGTTAFSSLLPNATSEAFYLVHGGNDIPATRFTPMLNALIANCAIVNSLLMPGVNHTIDFPNRNQILSDAYDWIDSVNHAPIEVNTNFGLLSPPNSASITIEGFSDQKLNYIWESANFAPNCTEYELLIDVVGGNFSAPVLTIPSGNNGSDTSITNTFHEVDSTLKAQSIGVGNSLTFKWVAAAKFYNKHVDTTKSFTLTLRREKVGMTLVTPGLNSTLTLANNLNLFFDWTDMTGSGITYDLLFDTLGGDFTSPLYVFESANSGQTSLKTLSHQELYYKVLSQNFNAQIGDTLKLIWTARAQDSTYSELAKSSRRLNLIIGNIGFKLISPPNNSITLGKKGVTINFIWDSIPLPNLTYEWQIDTIGGGLSNPITVFPSNNGGLSNKLSADITIIDSILNVNNIFYGDTFQGEWSVKASTAFGDIFALESFDIKIFRDFPEGVTEVNMSDRIEVYPNPADNLINIQLADKKDISKVIFYDLRGKEVLRQTHSETNYGVVSISTSGLSEGIYSMSITAGQQLYSKRVIITH